MSYGFEITTPAIQWIFATANPYQLSSHLAPKNSLDLPGDDRQLLIKTCLTEPEEHILITHGTDTMSVTGAALGAADIPKSIVITGSMIPERMLESDAAFGYIFFIDAP